MIEKSRTLIDIDNSKTELPLVMPLHIPIDLVFTLVAKPTGRKTHVVGTIKTDYMTFLYAVDVAVYKGTKRLTSSRFRRGCKRLVASGQLTSQDFVGLIWTVLDKLPIGSTINVKELLRAGYAEKGGRLCGKVPLEAKFMVSLYKDFPCFREKSIQFVKTKQDVFNLILKHPENGRILAMGANRVKISIVPEDDDFINAYI